MSDVSRPDAHSGKPHAFEIKSANLPLVALLLKTADLSELAAEWAQHYGDNPDFFENEPLVVDLSPMANGSPPPAVPDFLKLMAFLRRQRTCPVAVKGGNPAQMAAALAAGLVAAPEAVLQRMPQSASLTPEASKDPVESTQAQASGSAHAVGPVAVEPTQSGAPSLASWPFTEPLPALVVDKPLRSGQQVYARGRDLVVMAMVNPGAEVIADGHIHVYAPLRGRAVAGARGNGDARIFALSLEAELISIAGIYRTSDVPLPDQVQGHPAMVSLQPTPDGDKLVIVPIRN